MAARHPKGVAAFDFDGTLTRRDTLLPFLAQALGPTRLARDLVRLGPALLSYALGLTPNDVAKQKVLRRCLGGMSYEQLKQRAGAFATTRIPGMLVPAALARLRWHQSRGDRCIVVTASLDIYVEPWARSVGVTDVIASRLELNPDGTVTGTLAQGNCYGPEKVRRLTALLGPRERYRLYAYGDSRGDFDLLDHADEAYYRLRPWSERRTK